MSRRRRRVQPREPSRPLLIMELGSSRLHAQGLAYGKPAGVVAAMVGIRVKLVEADCADDLIRQVDRLRELGRTYATVFVVCHSGEHGVVTGDGEHMSWRDFARCLQGFAPQRVVLLACSAGRFEPGEALFAEVPERSPARRVG